MGLREELPKGRAVSASPWDIISALGEAGTLVQTGNGDGLGFVLSNCSAADNRRGSFPDYIACARAAARGSASTASNFSDLTPPTLWPRT